MLNALQNVIVNATGLHMPQDIERVEKRMKADGFRAKTKMSEREVFAIAIDAAKAEGVLTH